MFSWGKSVQSANKCTFDLLYVVLVLFIIYSEKNSKLKSSGEGTVLLIKKKLSDFVYIHY